ncbi:hypothetical protein ACFSCX_25650 [Bacillus salitolerans]|uniref:Adhesin domain-containing protein n=1 Tax=Bacillus salitolerans TaxID=1437434 RepID=A0ABW4M0A1_9BACI
MKKWIFLGSIFTMLVGCSSTRVFEESRELELATTSGVERLNVQTTSGDLIIKGDKDATTISVVAEIKRSESVKEDAIVLTLEQEGNEAELVSKFRPTFGFMTRQSMDITVTVPSHLSVFVKDESGDLRISDIDGHVEIDDDSGDIYVKNASNLSKIKDDSGEIIVENSAGLLTIDDESGDIEVLNTVGIKKIHDDSGAILVESCTGELQVDDQSGDLVIVDHSGNVSIVDGSGEIDIARLEGSIVVEDESGDISINNVTNDVTIENDGSGSKHIRGVKGKIID